jgi:hypothetical protein
MSQLPADLASCPPRGAGQDDAARGEAKRRVGFPGVDRRSLAAFCLWLVFGFVTWNVVFDRRVAVAAVAFTREQTRSHEQGLPTVSIADGFSPKVRTAAVDATAWAGGLTALGLILSVAAARSLRRPPPPAPPRPPEAGNEQRCPREAKPQQTGAEGGGAASLA